MTPDEHYVAAERCLDNAHDADDAEGAAYWQREAQVHATLAINKPLMEWTVTPEFESWMRRALAMPDLYPVINSVTEAGS